MIPRKTRAALRLRASQCCERCGKWGANNAHHRKNKSQGGPDTLSNLVLLCGSGCTGCHGWVTVNPDAAEAVGLTIKGTQAIPYMEPVLRFDIYTGDSGWVLLNDDGGIEEP